MKKYLWVLSLIGLLMLALPGSTLAQNQLLSGTFTYQGYLTNANGPVTGSCDFQFTLFNNIDADGQVGTPQEELNVPVNNGTFNVALGFGGYPFNGSDRYLEIAVRCPTGSGNYTTLIPRQAINPVPYAMSLYGLNVQDKDPSPNLIGGYVGNVVQFGVGATIGGGGNFDEPNRITDDYSTIGGGLGNLAGNNNPNTNDSAEATVGGGLGNSASGVAATVGGGYQNSATSSRSTISGGQLNRAMDQYTTVGGGQNNTASAVYATIGGGISNEAEFPYTTIAGGESNVAIGDHATVGGGKNNSANSFSTVPGGQNNIAGGAYSFAAGRNAQAMNDGSFVWGDSLDPIIASTAINQFTVRATGGVRFISAVDGVGTPTAGVTLAAGGGSWSSLSDRNAKSNFVPVDSQAVLQSVADMPISTWNYNAQDASIRHIGPMAQDFYTSFGVGEDNTHISTIDSEGVALAAIQGLYQQVQAKDAQIADLQAQLNDLKTRTTALEGGQPIGANGIPAWLLAGIVFIAGIQVVSAAAFIIYRKTK